MRCVVTANSLQHAHTPRWAYPLHFTTLRSSNYNTMSGMILARAGPKTIDYDVFVAGQPTTKWMRTAKNKLKSPPYTTPGKRLVLKPVNAAKLITDKLSVTTAFCRAEDPNPKYRSPKPISDRELEIQLDKSSHGQLPPAGTHTSGKHHEGTIHLHTGSHIDISSNKIRRDWLTLNDVLVRFEGVGEIDLQPTRI